MNRPLAVAASPVSLASTSISRRRLRFQAQHGPLAPTPLLQARSLAAPAMVIYNQRTRSSPASRTFVDTSISRCHLRFICVGEACSRCAVARSQIVCVCVCRVCVSCVCVCLSVCVCLCVCCVCEFVLYLLCMCVCDLRSLYIGDALCGRLLGVVHAAPVPFIHMKRSQGVDTWTLCAVCDTIPITHFPLTVAPPFLVYRRRTLWTAARSSSRRPCSIYSHENIIEGGHCALCAIHHLCRYTLPFSVYIGEALGGRLLGAVHSILLQLFTLNDNRDRHCALYAYFPLTVASPFLVYRRSTLWTAVRSSSRRPCSIYSHENIIERGHSTLCAIHHLCRYTLPLSVCIGEALCGRLLGAVHSILRRRSALFGPNLHPVLVLGQQVRARPDDAGEIYIEIQ